MGWRRLPLPAWIGNRTGKDRKKRQYLPEWHGMGYAMLDLLLTSDSIGEARDRTQERLG